MTWLVCHPNPESPAFLALPAASFDDVLRHVERLTVALVDPAAAVWSIRWSDR